MGTRGQDWMARRGSMRVWCIAIALAAVFTIVLDFAALGARSNASVGVDVVGPAAIALPGAPSASSSAASERTTSSPPDDDTDTNTHDAVVEESITTTVPEQEAPHDTPAPALGRTEMLDIARAPDALGAGPVFAYTASDASDSTDLVAALGGARLWRAPLDGMSPVTIGGVPAGFAYPHDGEWYRPLSTSAAGTTVVSNLAAGGAIWEWTDSSGTQFVNHYDLGREMQASFFIRSADGRKLNPTEAGDRFADSRIAVALRHQAPLASGRVDGERQSTLSVPLEWSPPRVDSRAGTTHPVIYPDVRLGKELELAFGGRPNVARYDTILTLPAAAKDGDLEAPTAYLRNEFNHLFTLDATSGVLERVEPKPFDKKGLDWTPASGRGAVIASDADGSHAFAIYAATTSAGGTITRFTAHDFHTGQGSGGATDVGTVKIRALRIGNFPAGTTRTTSYIVTGTLASVQMDIAALAAAGVR